MMCVILPEYCRLPRHPCRILPTLHASGALLWILFSRYDLLVTAKMSASLIHTRTAVDSVHREGGVGSGVGSYLSWKDSGSRIRCSAGSSEQISSHLHVPNQSSQQSEVPGTLRDLQRCWINDRRRLHK